MTIRCSTLTGQPDRSAVILDDKRTRLCTNTFRCSTLRAMTPENSATCWRDLTDQLTAQQISMLADDEATGFTPACLLFNARDLVSWNAGAAVHGAVWWGE